MHAHAAKAHAPVTWAAVVSLDLDNMAEQKGVGAEFGNLNARLLSECGVGIPCDERVYAHIYAHVYARSLCLPYRQKELIVLTAQKSFSALR